MQILTQLVGDKATKQDLIVLGSFSKTSKEGKKDITTAALTGWDKEVKASFNAVTLSKEFTGAKDQTFTFDHEGTRYLAYGLGDKKDYTAESLRRAVAKIVKAVSSKYANVQITFDHFIAKGNKEASAHAATESIIMTDYNFAKYKSKKTESKLKKLTLLLSGTKAQNKKVYKAIEDATKVAESINVARDFVNEPPNVLNSVSYSKLIEKDVKANLKGVKTKILGKAELKKEKMGMFLSVNAGSAFDPRLVHLTYTPKKATKKTKHIAFVGKGLTFDTGGYSLKPGGSIINMKFDMAGSSTVYAAFRAAVLLELPVKISCFLGLTDNAINSEATMPDSIVTARNGKTVEILNTDAEGRLVLGDVLDYACDHKPDMLIDAATLTGACLIALGTEVCGVMSNDQKLADKLLKSAKATDEYMWQLPIIDEWRNDMKSPIADLKNIGGSRWGGTAKAAAFLENFVQDGISWAHLDIAGCGDSQSHLPYCPSKGGSGLIIRTLVDLAKNA
ncbi:MAG: leucyl aminopeptidase [Oligoflexia bacterium]|nr:leucyl aminopeptidase [Oligoflexia bacterium]